MLNKPIELLPIEARIVEVLATNHKGKENAITSKQMTALFRCHGSTLRYHINNIRARGIPICSCNSGYYYPMTAEECRKTVDYLSERLNAIYIAVRGVESGEKMLEVGVDPRACIAVTLTPAPLDDEPIKI